MCLVKKKNCIDVSKAFEDIQTAIKLGINH